MKRIVLLLALLPFAAFGADVKISALPAGTTLAGTEAIPAVQSAATVKTTPAALSTYIESQLTSADVIGKWTGTCSASTFLRADGACSFQFSSAEPRTQWNETDGATNGKLWDVDTQAGTWCLRARTDADGAGFNVLCSSRTAGAPAAADALVLGDLTAMGANMVFNGNQIVFTSQDEVDFFAEVVSLSASSDFGVGAEVIVSSDKNVTLLAGQGGTSSQFTLHNDAGDIDVAGGGADGDILLATAGTGTIDLIGAAVSKGTKFTATGCSNGTTLGGRTAGSFASGTTGTCTVVIALPTAPNGWACAASNISTGISIPQSAVSTTSCTISGATTSGNVVVFQAIGY